MTARAWTMTLTVCLCMSWCGTLAASPDACFTGRCTMEIDHHRYVIAPCSIDAGDFGVQFSGKSKYFASIILEDGVPHGYWNGVAAESHAQTDLGILKQDGTCWRNGRATICIVEQKRQRCDE